MKKTTYWTLLILFFFAGLKASSAQIGALSDSTTLLIYFLPGTPNLTIQATKMRYNATEVKILPNTQVRIWSIGLPVNLGNITLSNIIEVSEHVKSNTTSSRPNPNLLLITPPIIRRDTNQATRGLGNTTWNPLPRPSVCMGSNNITVAVTDCGGIDPGQVLDDLLEDKIWRNLAELRDNLDNDRNGYLNDYTGWNWVGNNNNNIDDHTGAHGSVINGIMTQILRDAVLTTGGNVSSVKLMNLKVFNSNGKGSLRSLLEAIDYAIGKKVKIMNCSFSYDALKTDIPNSLLGLVMEMARTQNDMLFVVAAGNSNINLDDPNNRKTVFPAGLPNPNIIVVGASDELGKKASFSNYGAVSVDIAALGQNIENPLNPSSIYLSGTSLSAAYVTVTAALIGTLRPIWSSTGAKNAILNYGTVPSGNPWNGLSVSSKVLNVPASLRCPINGTGLKKGASSSESVELLSAAPNPFNETVQIKVHSETTSESIVSIENAFGQVIFTQKMFCQAGENVLEWQANQASAGMYIVKVLIANQTLTQKIVKQ